MIVLILTRWHEDDLVGRVLATAKEAKEKGEFYDDWEVIEYKAIATEDSEYRKKGDALWPGKFPIEQLQTIRSSLGSYEFSSLYQQTPVDEENRKFKKDWFKYRAYEDLLHKPTYNTMSIDPRGKSDIKLGKDFIGVTINLIDENNVWNVMSSREKLTATGLIDLMFANWQKYSLHKIGIEDNQFTQGLMVSVESEMKLRGIYLDIELLKHGGTQKELRIEALVPRYEHNGIFHLTRNGINACVDLEEELLQFPKAINDDAGDSLAYQKDIAQKPFAEDSQSVTAPSWVKRAMNIS